jgi:hypothetical protein
MEQVRKAHHSNSGGKPLFLTCSFPAFAEELDKLRTEQVRKAHHSNSGGKPLFLTCSIFRSLNSRREICERKTEQVRKRGLPPLFDYVLFVPFVAKTKV